MLSNTELEAPRVKEAQVEVTTHSHGSLEGRTGHLGETIWLVRIEDGASEKRQFLVTATREEAKRRGRRRGDLRS